MNFGIEGCRALVTGGSRGIGKAIVTMLAEEGVHVCFSARDSEHGLATEKLLRDSGLSVEFIAADLETDTGIDVLAAVQAKFTPDIVVNNLGGSANPAGAGRDFWDIPSQEWLDTYYKCVVGAVRLVNALIPAMRAQQWGRIINISSAAGLEPPDDTPPEYSVAKAAMNTMTMTLSRDLGGSGITVNTVSPGSVLTEGFQDWLAMLAVENGWGDDLQQQEIMFLKTQQNLSVSRLGRPQDIGAAVAFLASKHSDYINGTNFRVDGGLSRAAI